MEQKSKTLFINCEEATQICDKSQYKEVTLWQAIKLKTHFLYCKMCRKYTKKNTKLSSLCSKANLKTLDPKEKEKIRKVLDSEISKNQK